MKLYPSSATGGRDRREGRLSDDERAACDSLGARRHRSQCVQHVAARLKNAGNAPNNSVMTDQREHEDRCQRGIVRTGGTTVSCVRNNGLAQ
jgi:hypothetical protein